MDLTAWFSLLGLALVLLSLIRWPTHRRQMAFGALFSLPVISLEFLSAEHFNRLGVTPIGAVEYLALTTLGVMSLGAVGALLAEYVANRWLTPTVHDERSKLLWLLLGPAVVGLSLAFGWSLGLSLVFGLIADVVALLWLGRELIW